MSTSDCLAMEVVEGGGSLAVGEGGGLKIA